MGVDLIQLQVIDLIWSEKKDFVSGEFKKNNLKNLNQMHIDNDFPASNNWIISQVSFISISEICQPSIFPYSYISIHAKCTLHHLDQSIFSIIFHTDNSIMIIMAYS